jgi:hypothetical protein
VVSIPADGVMSVPLPKEGQVNVVSLLRASTTLGSRLSSTACERVLALVQRLDSLEHDVVLGVSTCLDHRHPGNDRDRIRLGGLLAVGRERAAATWDPPLVRPLMERLERVVPNIDLRAGGSGIVVIATPDLAAALLLPVPVAERVATGASPAISTLRNAVHAGRTDDPLSWG